MKHRHVFYRDRPEWADVKPVPQYEPEIDVVRIAYSPEFVDAHDYMRAVLLKDERSERALEITDTVLQLNPANYTVWEYRRRILETLGSDLTEELKFVGKLMDENSKNYQLWHHRQWVVTQLAEKTVKTNLTDPHESLLNLGMEELSFITSVIDDDSKHYHAWQHRRWVFTYFKLPVSIDLNDTEALIKEDVYNNSAWNHRFVTVTTVEGLTPSVLQRELEFVKSNIRLAPNNESSWNYLYGLLVPPPTVTTSKPGILHCNGEPATKLEVVDETVVGSQATHVVDRHAQLVTHSPSAANTQIMRKFAEDLADSDPVASNSVALLSFLVDVYADAIENLMTSGHQSGDEDQHCAANAYLHPNPVADSSVISKESVWELAERAQSICERLAVELDRIRITYWRYRSRQIQALITKRGDSTHH